VDNLVWALVGCLLATLLFLVLAAQISGKLGRIDRQLAQLMKQAGIDPVEVSNLVKELARDPARKIHAIKALREETGLGLAEAKRVVEDIARTTGV
jgi:ribosomal protein L7/L12